MVISEATMKNWKRLTPDVFQKLRKGANKTSSIRRICPREYIRNKETFLFLEEIHSICRSYNIPVTDAVYTIAVKILKQKGIFQAENVQKTLAQYSCKLCTKIYEKNIPANEPDILGTVYQSLLSEGEKNTSGSYYTPFPVISEMLKNTEIGGKYFLDPCCGSGAFLLSLAPDHPEQLWGCDCDPTAVMIAKVNLLCKYASYDFIPNIFCCDYLAENTSISHMALFHKKFDLIATNPPWGSKKSYKHQPEKNSFFLFFQKAYQQLCDEGQIIFLFPEAVLNIRTHTETRKMLLTQTHLNCITLFEENFTGVMTKYVAIDAQKAEPSRFFLMKTKNSVLKKDVSEIYSAKDKIISFTDDRECKLLKKIKLAQKYDLSASTFALGIVTGNNKEKIMQTAQEGAESIYTGKEIGKYTLKKAKNYIFYTRDTFQQTAKEEYYRAEEKLIYRFISKYLLFSYDDSKNLCLNSANILIPQIPGYSIKTVLAFLNSDLLRYYYMKSFQDIKILKSNLCQLPFPEITPYINRYIEELVEKITAGNIQEEKTLQKVIFDCYDLNEQETALIQQCCQEQIPDGKE